MIEVKTPKTKGVVSGPLWKCYPFRSTVQYIFFNISKKLVVIITRRERPKLAPYLRLNNIRGTTIGNIWKKNYFFFQKKYLVKSHNAEKPKKRGHLGSFNVFYKPKTSKKCKGVLFDKIRKFSKKSRIVPKKTQFMVQCENRTHALRLGRRWKMNKYERWTNCKKSGPLRVRLSTEKKLLTVRVGLFSLREKAPTKNRPPYYFCFNLSLLKESYLEYQYTPV